MVIPAEVVGGVVWRQTQRVVISADLNIFPFLAGSAALSRAGSSPVLQAILGMAKLGLAKHLAAQGRDPGEDVWRGGLKKKFRLQYL